MSVRSRPVSVAIVGATGYTGAELVRLLAPRPDVLITKVTSERSAGCSIREVCPWLAADMTLTPFQPHDLEADAVFLCLESGHAAKVTPSLLARGIRVIDLSADFRLKAREAYPRFYGWEHPDPKLLGEAVYGLPELADRGRIADARLVANPGCYPTATALALRPLVEAGLVSGPVVVDAKSGVSGAGRSKSSTEYLFSEVDDSFRAYAPTGHRHTPEIAQATGAMIRFTPHLLPTARGILSTLHVPLRGTHTPASLTALLSERYHGEPFVAVTDRTPSTKEVRGSNRCVIGVAYDEDLGFAVLTSVIDNLVKGASGQAIQNFNLMFDLGEATGLPRHGVWP